MSTIDRNSPIPLYYQLKQILSAKIDSGEWKADMLIPSENQLQDTYKLSRTTVRQTLSDLVNEGKLNRERGRGTFVTRPRNDFVFPASESLNINNFEQDHNLSWTLLGRGWMKCDEKIAHHLEIPSGSDVYHLHRLRYVEGAIIGEHRSYIPPEVYANINEERFLEGASHDYFESYPGMRNVSVKRMLEATLAEKTDVECLKVKRNDPILQMQRVIEDRENGAVIEYLLARFRGDTFKFQFGNVPKELV